MIATAAKTVTVYNWANTRLRTHVTVLPETSGYMFLNLPGVREVTLERERQTGINGIVDAREQVIYPTEDLIHQWIEDRDEVMIAPSIRSAGDRSP